MIYLKYFFPTCLCHFFEWVRFIFDITIDETSVWNFHYRSNNIGKLNETHKGPNDLSNETRLTTKIAMINHAQ